MEPLIQGGQGREDHEVEDYAKVSIWCWIGMFGIALVAALLLGGCKSIEHLRGMGQL